MKILSLLLGLVFVSATSSAQKKPVLVDGVPVINPVMNEQAAQTNTANKIFSPSYKITNDCGVTASFNPGYDSFFTANTVIEFTNTSTNASSLKWFENGVLISTSNSINLGFQPGYYEIKLVASNGNCSDTFSVNILCTGTLSSDDRFYSGALGFSHQDERSSAMAAGPGENFLLAGTTNYKGQGGLPNGLLVKLTKAGCIEWSRMLMNSLTINEVKTLKDSGYLVSGFDFQGNYLMKIDKNGSGQWKKYYTSNNVQIGFMHLYEMQDGSIIGTNSTFSNGFIVVKMSPLGDVTWSRFLQQGLNDYAMTTAIHESPTHLFITGSVKLPDPDIISTGPFISFLAKLDPATGAEVLSRQYQVAEPSRSFYIQDIIPYGNQLLVSAFNYNTLGGSAIFPSLQWLDSNGIITKSFALKQNNYTGGFPTAIGMGVLPGGNLMLHFKNQQPLSLQPGYYNLNYFFKINTADQIAWQQYKGGGLNDMINMARFNGYSFGTLGWGYSHLVPRFYVSENLMFNQVDSSGANEGCFNNTSHFSVQPHNVVSNSLDWIVDSIPIINVTPVDIELPIVYTQTRSLCPDYVDSCSILKIKGPSEICDLGEIYTYRAGKNTKCPQPVSWIYEGNLNVVAQTDSSLSVQFLNYGSFKISALLQNSCTPVKDSMFVLADDKSYPIQLGSDTSICPGNSLLLHASPHFFSYEWQDGSTDSLLTIHSPGIYWVKVTDSCGKQSSDTLQVSLTASVPISIGADREKCNTDSLVLTAPAGFINYQWSNNYNISSLNGQEVIVYPLVDTAYYIRAELNPGCFAYDTVRIDVHNSPPINLGIDVNFCEGESASFDAGAGFSSYEWNTGASTPQISVNSIGMYTVTGTDMNGCISRDTVKVLNVWPLPQFSIVGDTVLCRNGTASLRVTPFTNAYTYLWNTGSMESTIEVSSLGEYSMQVTSGNGCKGYDTAWIEDIIEAPTGFLPADTSICSYGSIELKSMGSFQSYLWSNGSQSSATHVNAAGEYWLEVRNSYGCPGRDSIVVIPKECMKGLYVPSAFSPNGDGKNDRLKAFIFGSVKQFRFTVYNRWGQVVFTTTDPARSWSGTLGGVQQGNHVFVWQCTYQLEGEEMKTEKGTVLLVR